MGHHWLPHGPPPFHLEPPKTNHHPPKKQDPDSEQRQGAGRGAGLGNPLSIFPDENSCRIRGTPSTCLLQDYKTLVSALGHYLEKKKAEIWGKPPSLSSSRSISPIQEGIRGGWDAAMGEGEHSSTLNSTAIPAESP